jgi:hypothetical protein
MDALQSNASSGEGSFHRRELDAAFAGSSFPQEVRDLMRRLRFSRHEVICDAGSRWLGLDK